MMAKPPKLPPIMTSMFLDSGLGELVIELVGDLVVGTEVGFSYSESIRSRFVIGDLISVSKN